jgi:hypothetical protein
MHPEKAEKMKALDMMIVVGKPKEDEGMKYDKGDKEGKAGSVQDILAMHPLDKMSDADLKELYLAIDEELESRGSFEEDEYEDNE